jgi:hypothetical protein
LHGHIGFISTLLTRPRQSLFCGSASLASTAILAKDPAGLGTWDPEVPVDPQCLQIPQKKLTLYLNLSTISIGRKCCLLAGAIAVDLL